ncbi:hypothetical protein PFICI_00424 [Pestalotiopsis fici W106-1]|uniref:Pentatricopeptide repeat-containing protein n=1 Tax=Pestalotiopsis fici (strain W106-1 / CGMCC3.15140) TaxID=1229662 RepID=W3XMS2_PESFW|nr:uncharacterized protein PFICI_00424 [Pestalotiopsis fici W106-1]ETS86596.1 hypothetical protein PFICI_00424 [Pestalotiopsis fici W106-1]
MPPSTFLIEKSSQDYICRSCLLGLRKPPPATPAQWGVRRASQAAAKAARAARAARTSTTPRKPQSGDDSERLQTLKKLGLLQKDEEHKATVNYFQEDGGKIRRLSGVDEFSKALTDPGGEMEAELKSMEKDTGYVRSFMDMLFRAQVDEPKRNPDVLKDELEKALKVNKPLDSNALEALDDLSKDLYDESDGPIYIDTSILVANWPRTHLEKIVRLNNNLQLASRQLDRGAINKQGFGVWKWYYGARQLLATDWKIVPPATWELLWDIFSVESSKNPNRWHHLHILAKDMNEAGVELAPKRQLLAIEATFLEGWHKEAVDNHKRKVTTLGADPKTFLEFWQLGFRMYCQIGDLERAERTAEIILTSKYPHDARFLFPLIRAFAEKTETADKAYNVYEEIRTRLGEQMTIEDYDVIISYFLAAQQSEIAFSIFVEMMTSGRLNLRKSKRSDKLPPSVANEFFVGKWLKRLTLIGDFEGAHKALLHMKSKGVMPRPMVVNVLVGSWLRTGVAENVQKAEDLAWAMINSRLQFVQLRQETRGIEGVVPYKPGLKIVYSMTGPGWPKATLETFSLLAENYKDRGLIAKMEELWEAFKRAEMGADTFFMNQLLFSMVRSGRGGEVINLFRAMMERFSASESTPRGLEPDSWTFLALWQSLTANRLQHWGPESVPKIITESRVLFAEMVRYAHNFQQEDVGVNFQLARTIMHTFRRAKDPVSMLVAYRALRQVFNLQDPGSMVLEMIVGTTNLEKAAGDSKMRSQIITATKHTEKYLSQRQQEMVASGELRKNEEMPNNVRSAEMGDYLELHLEAELSKIKGAEELFVQAASDMGVYNNEDD